MLAFTMSWIGNEELFAMAAFALPDRVHASHRPAPPPRRQSFRSLHPNPVHGGKKIHPIEEELFGVKV
jgi:hypothetical protein